MRQELAFLIAARKADWEILSRTLSGHFLRTGDFVLRQVGRTQAPFIVAKGEFEVIQGGGRHGPKSLALIRSGSVFGEQTFFEIVHVLADG